MGEMADEAIDQSLNAHWDYEDDMEWRFDEGPDDHFGRSLGRGFLTPLQKQEFAHRQSMKRAEQAFKTHKNTGETRTTMTTKTTKTTRVEVVTPECRVSYPNVFTPSKVNKNDPNEKPFYNLQMLFRTKDTKESLARGEKSVDIEPLKQAVRQVMTEKFGPREQGKWPKCRFPFRDGMETEKKDKEGFGEGVVFCSAKSEQKPGVVNQQVQPILDPAEFYGGCYARVALTVYWYDKAGNRGVAFGLSHVQKVRDGEPFSGRIKAEDAFDAIPMPDGPTDASDPMSGGEQTGGAPASGGGPTDL